MSTSQGHMALDEQDERVVFHHALGDLKAFKVIFDYTRSFHSSFLFGLLFLLFGAVCGVVTAKCLGLLVDKGILPGDKNETLLWAGSIIFLEIIALLSTWKGKKVLAKSSSLTIYKIRQAIFEDLQKLPLSFFDRHPQGRLVTRATHDVEGLENFLTGSVGNLLHACFMAILTMIGMLVTDFSIGGLLLLSALPLLLFIYGTRRFVRRVNRDISRTNASVNSHLSELLSGIDLIRSHALESWSNKEFEKRVGVALSSQLRANFFYSWGRPLMSFFCSLPLIGLVWIGGQRVLLGEMALGVFVTFVRYCERFSHPIMKLTREIHIIQQAFSSAERIASFFAHPAEDEVLGKDGHRGPCEGPLKGRLVFDHVWMYYPSPEKKEPEWILKDVSLCLEPGETVGLAGSTGGGKTTLVGLMGRLYDYQKGDIYLDGHSLRDFQRNFLREHIGLVAQEAVVFHGSLRDNLSLGPKSDPYILDCCEKTGLSSIMERKQLTLNSTLLEDGYNLSSGEKQIVALTRILIKNPSFLILDEATSNIDPRLEQVIHNAINVLMVGRTCLIIAHRLATFDRCDRILVFHRGTLVEEGPQKNLLEKRGFFYRLHRAQDHP